MTKTDEKWVERIREWQESGKTAEAFALGKPYKASTLKWRAAIQRRLAKDRSQDDRASAPIRMVRVVSSARAKLIAPSGGLVVEVSGARISLSRGFDAELFADVVQALAVRAAR